MKQTAMKTSPPLRQEYAAKLILIGLFWLLFALVALLIASAHQTLDEFRLSTFDFTLLGFATLRLGRLVAYDLIVEPLRRPFTRTVPDKTGAGETVEPRGQGVRRALGQLISCPICAGTWIAAFLVYALSIFPGPTRLFLAMTAVIGLVELLNALLEAMCWLGHYVRTFSGAQEIFKDRANNHQEQDFGSFLEQNTNHPFQAAISAELIRRNK